MDGIDLPPMNLPEVADIDFESTQSLELLVYNLDHSSPTSAATELNRTLDTLRDTIPPNITAVAPRSRSNADHAKVIGGTINEMAEAKKVLQQKGLHVCWSPMAGEDKTRKISYGLRPYGNPPDVTKAREEIEKTLKEQFGVETSSWYISQPRNDADETRAHVRIKCDHETIGKIASEKLEIGKKSLSPKAADYVVPNHPYQLIIACPETLGVNKIGLDAYIGKKFGLRWSELLFQNQYTFIVNDWNAVRDVFSNWNPSEAGLGDVPKPQLVYVYNGSKYSQPPKASEEISMLRMQQAHLARVGTDIAETMASSKHEMMLEPEKRDNRLIELLNATRAADRAENQLFLSTLVDKFTESNARRDENFAMLTSAITGALLSQHRLVDLHRQLHQMERQISETDAQDEHALERKTDIETQIKLENTNFLHLIAPKAPSVTVPAIPAPTKATPANPNLAAGTKRTIESLEQRPEKNTKEDWEMVIDDVSHLSTPKLMDIVNSTKPLRSSPAARAGRMRCLFLSIYPILVALLYSFYSTIMYLYSKKHWRLKISKPRPPKTRWLILILLLANTAWSMPTGPHSGSLSIWTLNVAGGQSLMKMNAIHDQIMNGNPDIFILTDTKSDGVTIRSQWNWQDYQIREVEGTRNGNLNARNFGILIGVRRHLPIVPEPDSVELENLAARFIHLTIKIEIQGRGVKIKIIGIYLHTMNKDLNIRTGAIRGIKEWLDQSQECHWIMAGDFNLTTAPEERLTSENTQVTREYRRLLTNGRHTGYDWWETRDRHYITDYTRKPWNTAGNDGNTGKSIVDRIASSSLFQNVIISNRPELFVPGTDHIWVTAKAEIHQWERYETTSDAQKSWTERRIQIPKKAEKLEKVETFKQIVEEKLTSENTSITTKPITNDTEFDDTYAQITEVIVQSSIEAFGNRKFKSSKRRDIITPEISRKLNEVRRIGRIISASKFNRLGWLIESNPWAPPLVHEIMIRMARSKNEFTVEARKLGKEKRKELYRTEKEAAERIRTKLTTKQTIEVLNGGFSKKLAGQIAEFTTPTIVTSTDPNSGREMTVSNPSQVKEHIRDYFQNLFKKSHVPAESGESKKPWMQSETSKNFINAAEIERHQWPPTISTNLVKQLLRKGKPAPSPGPDLWEKWCVRHLPDTAIQIVTNLLEYIVRMNYFPANLTETTLLTLFKKGDTTKVSNYRGIMLTNVLMTVRVASVCWSSVFPQ